MEDAFYVLGPVSSLIAWRAAMEGRLEEPTPSEGQVDLTRACARVRELRALPVVRRLGDVPLDVLVGNINNVHVCVGLDTIVMQRPLPPGSLYLVDGVTYICGPELCFLLLARGGLDIHLAEIGCELCGTYFIAHDQSGDFDEGPALTSVEKISSYLDMMGQRHGIKAARAMLDLVGDGSASPRETSMFLMLCSDERWGGYAIRRPELNAAIDIPEYAQLLLGKEHLEVDELWRDEQGNPCAVAEYDSNLHHLHHVKSSGEKTIAVEKVLSDDLRREVIREKEIDVVTVRTEDTTSFERFEAKARRIAKLVGSMFLPSQGHRRNLRITLFVELFDTRHWRKEHQHLRKMAGYERIIRKKHGSRPRAVRA